MCIYIYIHTVHTSWCGGHPPDQKEKGEAPPTTKLTHWYEVETTSNARLAIHIVSRYGIGDCCCSGSCSCSC